MGLLAGTFMLMAAALVVGHSTVVSSPTKIPVMEVIRDMLTQLPKLLRTNIRGGGKAVEEHS